VFGEACIKLQRQNFYSYYDLGYLFTFFSRCVKDLIRVPGIETRVPTGPYWVPNIFLKKTLIYCLRILVFFSLRLRHYTPANNISSNRCALHCTFLIQ